jgi:hypothetical protein
MPAPEDLQTQTPGEPLATMTPLASAADANTGNPGASETGTAAAQAPAFVVKHRSGGVFYVLDTEGQRVGDFQGTKPEALIEAQRLTDGGAPFVATYDDDDDEPVATQAAGTSNTVDATKLKSAVMTTDGWLCPELPVKE